jgi:hypothetical protein
MDRNHPQKSILGRLREMAVGDQIEFPAARLTSVKSMCSTFGFQWNRKYSTSTNREKRTFTVTRKQ